MGKKQSNLWLNRDQCLRLQKRFGDYETYEETGGGRGENKRSIIRVINNIISEFKHKPNILEVGSGPGHFIWVFKDKCEKITGMDISNEMINICNDIFKNYKYVNFVNGSCWKIPFDNNIFDLVYQVDVCMHVGGSFESLLEMIRVSKKYIIFTGPSFEDFNDDIDKQIGKLSWAISVPILNKNLNKLIVNKTIKKYYYVNRPETKMYKHRILVIEK